MAETIQIARQFSILNLLNEHKHGLTISELHKRIKRFHGDVTQRTIRRDIEQLSSFFPIHDDNNGTATIFILNKFQLGDMTFSLDDFYALTLTKALLSEQMENVMFTNAKEIINKILAQSNNLNPEWISCIENALIVHNLNQKETDLDTGIVNQILQALVDHKCITIDYYSFTSNEKSGRTIEPYKFLLQEGKLHILAYCQKRNEIRDFRVSRISNVVEQETNFEVDDEGLEHYHRKRFINLIGEKEIDMILQFTGEKARYIKEYEEHNADELREEVNGTLLFYKRTAMSNEVIKWILGFGQHVKVVEPLILKESIIQEINNMHANYNSAVT